ncbi:hypothetical protein L6164_016967 [Bauhinia variegata]|uniref:Uncharacterized protein n=1 Tax=Bauhinia variegata TaxID=167791 RepID=A0ACB9NA19_BAUVA|nr:hypothetical protein L6164_016967 [Bauhinia variegata]
MHITSQNFIVNLTPLIGRYRQRVDGFSTPSLPFRNLCLFNHPRHDAREFSRRKHARYHPSFAVLSDAQVSSVHFEEFFVSTTSINDRELKVSVEVSGPETQMIFDDVFKKMVAAAQPIPGLRRVKGGKTPTENIPKEILLELLGPSKVYKEVIKKIINSTVAKFVEKENLKAGKDLRVEQSFEDLESTFEEGQKFCFDAVIQLLE